MHRQKGEQAPTPVTLRYGDDYYYDYTHDTYNTYDGDIYYSEEDYEKSEHPIRYGIEQNLKDAVIRYGYDPETVNAWFESESVQWSDLMEAQKAAQQELAIAEVHAVNEYVKGILDNAMKDVRNNQQQWQAEFVATLEEKVADFHTDLDN